jgi:hypothetical protein
MSPQRCGTCLSRVWRSGFKRTSRRAAATAAPRISRRSIRTIGPREVPRSWVPYFGGYRGVLRWGLRPVGMVAWPIDPAELGRSSVWPPRPPSYCPSWVRVRPGRGARGIGALLPGASPGLLPPSRCPRRPNKRKMQEAIAVILIWVAPMTSVKGCYRPRYQLGDRPPSPRPGLRPVGDHKAQGAGEVQRRTAAEANGPLPRQYPGLFKHVVHGFGECHRCTQSVNSHASDLPRVIGSLFGQLVRPVPRGDPRPRRFQPA